MVLILCARFARLKLWLTGFADTAGKDGAGALGRADQKKPAGVEAFADAGEAVSFVDTDALAANPGGASFETGTDALRGGLEVGGCGKGGEFGVERSQEGEQQVLARPVAAGFDEERSGGGAEFFRKLRLVDVDADADDGVADACDFGIEFGEDAAEFFAAEEEVVGPAEIGLK